MTEPSTAKPEQKATGYHIGSVDTVISVEDVVKQAEQLGDGVSLDDIAKFSGNDPFVNIKNLRAGYGKMEILHDFNLQVAKGQSLCLIGLTARVNQLCCILFSALPISFLDRFWLVMALIKTTLLT